MINYPSGPPLPFLFWRYTHVMQCFSWTVRLMKSGLPSEPPCHTQWLRMWPADDLVQNKTQLHNSRSLLWAITKKQVCKTSDHLFSHCNTMASAPGRNLMKKSGQNFSIELFKPLKQPRHSLCDAVHRQRKQYADGGLADCTNMRLLNVNHCLISIIYCKGAANAAVICRLQPYSYAIILKMSKPV